MREVTGARDMVPSPREIELGLAAADAQTQPAPEAPWEEAPPSQRARIRAAFRDYVRDADPRRIEGPKLALVVLGVGSFIGGWSANLIGLFFPEIRREFGIDLRFMFTASAVMGIAFTLLRPFFGFLADRARRVWMLRFGFFVQNAALVGVGQAPTVPQLMGAYAVNGTGKAFSEPAGAALMPDYFPVTARARVYSFTALLGTIGSFSGLAFAGLLADRLGWRVVVTSLGVIGLMLSTATFLLREPKRGYHDRLALGASKEVAEREQAPVTWGEAWRAAGAIKSVRRMWYATPFMHLSFVSVGVVLSLYYAEEFGLGPGARANIELAGAVVGMVGLIIGGPLADRLLAYKPGRVPQALAAMVALNAINVIVLVFSNNLWLSIAVRMPINFVNALVAPAELTLLSLTIPARLRGLGLQSFAPWTLLALLLQPFIGAIIDANTLRTGLLMFAPLMLLAAGIVWTVGYSVDHDMRNALAASMADEEAARARAAGEGKIVVARDVDVHYDGVQVLFGVDLDVYEGEILALLGTNGAGKSTLLRALSGLSEPTAGAIVMDGRDTTHMPPHEIASLGIAQLPGGRAVFPTLTVRENLRAAAWLADPDQASATDEEIARLTTETFPALRARLDQPAGALSGGEQQMLGLAQAFLMRPRLLLIDELSLGLAPAVVAELLDTLRALRDRGVTIVVVEQSVNLALRIADRAVFMEKGQIRFVGPAAELAERSDLVRSVFLRAPGAGDARRGTRATEATAEAVALAADGVGVSFGGVAALRGVSVEIARGEIVGIVGPNGAGKTTLFDVLSGFVPPDTGSVRIAGVDATALPPAARARLGLARSFQDSRLFPALTVRENLLVALERHLQRRNALGAALWTPASRRSEARAARRADALVETLGLGGYRDTRVGELSTGVRRLTDLAVQLAADPDVLLLDEPSSGVAKAETVELGAMLQRIRRDAGCSLLVIEHDLDLIADVSDRLIAMDLGRVITHGSPAQVLADERVVAAYLGGAEETAPARSKRKGDA